MQPKLYRRRILTDAELQQVRHIAMRIDLMPNGMRLNMISEIIAENARLADEVNNHRSELGYELLITYQNTEEHQNG